MLDSKLTLFSFSASAPTIAPEENHALILKSCNVYAFSAGRIFSELDELTFDSLNCNDYGCGTLELELVISNGIVKEAYPDFYTKCVVIRTNTKCFIKPMKINNKPHCSKVNRDGDLVIGIRYYFRDENQIQQIQSCTSLLVEGFIALGKPKNVFGVMCQLEKENGTWKISSSFTYKPKYAGNIKNLID